MLKRWDFWYSGVLLEHWLPGPASDWAGVLAGEKPPSRVRKKLAAAAVEAQYDAALGAGLGIPFFAKVLEWSQTGGTTLLVVSQTVRTEWEQLMRGLGDHVLDLVGHSKTAYLSLNKFFDDNVPLMSPVGQSLGVTLGGGGKCKHCPFSGFDASYARVTSRYQEWDKVITESSHNADTVSAGAAFPLDYLTTDPSTSYENEVRAGSLVPRLDPQVGYLEFTGPVAVTRGVVEDWKNQLDKLKAEAARILGPAGPLPRARGSSARRWSAAARARRRSCTP